MQTLWISNMMKERTLAITILVMAVSSGYVNTINVFAQAQESYYLQIPNNSIVWQYGSDLVVYKKDSTQGLVKVIGPSNFQSIPLTTLQQIEQDILSNPTYNYNGYNSSALSDIDNPQKWYFMDDKAIWVNVFRGYRQGAVHQYTEQFAIILNLTDLSYTINRQCYVCNTSGYSAGVYNIIQLNNTIHVIWDNIDTSSSPDDGYIFFSRIDGNGNFITFQSYYTLVMGFGGLIAPEVKVINNSGYLAGVFLKRCQLQDQLTDVYTIYVTSAGNVTTTYSNIVSCYQQVTYDPTLQSITFHNRVGSSAILTQTINNQSTTYRCELGGNGNTTASVLQPCTEFPNISPSGNVLYLIGAIKHINELISSNPVNTFAYYLFPNSISNPTSYSKSEYHILTSNYTFNLNNLGIKKFNDEQIVGLATEIPNNITLDPSYLLGNWQFISKDSSTNTSNTYTINNIYLSDAIVINNVKQDIASQPTQKLFIRWFITAGNTTIDRIMPTDVLIANNSRFANMLINNNITYGNVTVTFTDTAFNNLNTVIKLSGFNVLVNNIKMNNDTLQFFAIEGNCYVINQLTSNNTLQFMANVCPPPYQFVIGPSEAGSSGTLLGIYWWPNWYAQHIHYADLAKIDVIIHRNPAPFTYKVELKDKDGNMFFDIPYTQSPQDPVTVTITNLDADKYPYTLIVRGVETINNEEKAFIAYTATITKGYQVPFFLPFNAFGLNVMLLIVVASLAMWTRNTASIGIVVTVVIIAVLNWVGFLQLGDALITMLFFIAAIAIIAYRRLYS
jgi:hypothetical protein